MYEDFYWLVLNYSIQILNQEWDREAINPVAQPGGTGETPPPETEKIVVEK